MLKFAVKLFLAGMPGYARTAQEFANTRKIEIDGAMVGAGAQFAPPIKGGGGAGLMIYWKRGDPSTFLYRECIVEVLRWHVIVFSHGKIEHCILTVMHIHVHL